MREIAKAQVASLEQFIALPIKGLEIMEIQHKRNRTEIIYNIVD